MWTVADGLCRLITYWTLRSCTVVKSTPHLLEILDDANPDLVLINGTGGRHGRRHGDARASFGAFYRYSEDLRRRTPRGEESRPRHREGRVRHPAWPFGLGQDDHADDAGGLRGSDPWRDLPR